MITSSEHPWFKEGVLWNFLDFERFAIHASVFYETANPISLTSLKHDDDVLGEGCLDVEVYFTDNHCMELHLHPYKGAGEYGIYDVLGDLMTNDPINLLADLERVLH